jgi:magnesium protoporphyrin O-methyltransferase
MQHKQIDLEAIEADLRGPELFGAHDPSETSQNVRRYFETSGFSRWTAIYGEGGIPPIWRVIRDGHGLALDRVIDWIQDDGSRTALDAGCGTGVLSMRLSDAGYTVDGFDVSSPMVSYARYNTRDRNGGIPPRFFVGDIAALDPAERRYDLVCCLDVLFHYPYAECTAMLKKLADLSTHKIIGSFALATTFNSFWMEMGKRFFHQKNRMTNLHLMTYDQMEQVLYRAGLRVTRTHRVKKFFYDSFVFEAVRR